MTGPEDERAALLLERLLADPTLRARFRSDPAAVAREAGLEDLDADAFGGSAMQTLEARESRSSLAGVMMAAALEGVAGFGLVQDAAAHGRGLPPEVNQVLARDRAQRAAAPGYAATAPASSGAPGPADLATPEGAAANQAASQPAGPWSARAASASPAANAGVYSVVHPNSNPPAGGGPSADAQAHASASGDPTGQDTGSGDPTGQDSGNSADAADEATHNQDSSSGDSSGQDSSSGGSSGQAAPVDQGNAGGGNLGDAAAGYPGDGAPRAQIAGWMAREAQRNGLPPELPLMASLVESDMKNLKGGDLDSVGFFQMRMGIWNNGSYAGYSSKPQLQLKWFIDHALEVKKQRVAQGHSVTDPNQYGEWIADVERPAEQYRGRYQQHLQEARGLLAQAGSQGTSRPGGAQVANAASPVAKAAGAGGGGASPVARAAAAGAAAPNAGGADPVLDPNSDAVPDPNSEIAPAPSGNAAPAPSSSPAGNLNVSAPPAAQAPSAGTNAADNASGSGNANGNVAEDGGSGDTEAQADQESDGPGDPGDDASGDGQNQDSGSGDPTGQDTGSGDPTGQDSGDNSDAADEATNNQDSSSGDSSGQDSSSGGSSGAAPVDQAAPTPGGAAGGYVNPTPGYKPSSLDNGVDIETKPGTPLRAVGAGRIVTTQGQFPGGSVVLKLDHPVNGHRYVYYGHVGDANKKVSAGQRVSAGQVLANSAQSPPGAGDMPGHVEIGFAVDAQGGIETGGAYEGDRSKGSPLGAAFNSFLKGLK